MSEWLFEWFRKWSDHERAGLLAGLTLLIVGVVSLAPLLFEPHPREPIAHYTNATATFGTRLLVIGLAAVPIWIQTRLENGGRRTMLFIVMALIMASVHKFAVDAHPLPATWQREIYYDILNQKRDADDGQYRAPHQFRPLPYGFARALELLTGDRLFATLVYRAFFYYWLLWAAFEFARRFHTPIRALLTLVPLVLLYPMSIPFYLGQLTDPMSHALFVVALLCVVLDRPYLLAMSLALGVMAKETVVIVVPAYFMYAWYKRTEPGQVIIRTFGLGAVRSEEHTSEL